MTKYLASLGVAALVVPLLTLSADMLSASQSAIAQEEVTFLDEIIVTARKREENVLEIPESVSTISGALIERYSLLFEVPPTSLDVRRRSSVPLLAAISHPGWPTSTISFHQTWGSECNRALVRVNRSREASPGGPKNAGPRSRRPGPIG